MAVTVMDRCMVHSQGQWSHKSESIAVPSHNVVGVNREAVDNLVGVSLLRRLALER